MVKTFEQYNNQASLNLSEVERYLNNKKLLSIMRNVLSQLPKSWLMKINNYLTNKTIDIDKMISLEKKLNLREKIIKLYNSGVRNIKEIINRISPKNEGIVLGIFILIIATGMLGFAIYGIVEEIRDRTDGTTGIVLIFALLAVGSIIAWAGIDELKDKPEFRTIQVKVKKDNQQHKIILTVDKDGNYTAEEIDTENW